MGWTDNGKIMRPWITLSEQGGLDGGGGGPTTENNILEKVSGEKFSTEETLDKKLLFFFAIYGFLLEFYTI